MAERRMFHAAVVESDTFLDMTPAAQALYFHLVMQADDDGFINGPRQVCRRCGARMEELQELIEGKFILWFDGVAVVKHFRMANTLQNDRLKPLRYPEIAKKLYLNPNRIYTTETGKRKENLYYLRMGKMTKTGFQLDSEWIPNGFQLESQGKGIEKKRKEKNLTQPNRREGKIEEGDAPPPATYDDGVEGVVLLKEFRKGVVHLSNEQIYELFKLMGYHNLIRYVTRLANFILERDANIQDHFAIIFKWWQEDGGTYS